MTRFMKPLTVRDEVHGDMVFDPVIRNVIDHECFQRLRHIKQLGLAEYVFPCANHTRFQHSLGASYLAGQYLEKMMRSWLTSPFLFEGKEGKTTFFAQRTLDCVKSVVADPHSHQYWSQIVGLAGLLHDVGHGPWSHTFEHLHLKQDYHEITSQIPGPAGEYLRGVSRFHHEEISLLYIFAILRDLHERGLIPDAELYFLPVAGLVNRTLIEGALKEKTEQALTQTLGAAKIHGGLDFHRLLRPLISGPFDVDRMDYIQRDGRNSGVLIGGSCFRVWPITKTKKASRKTWCWCPTSKTSTY
jgi:HD superfamily phosphohydrolase